MDVGPLPIFQLQRRRILAAAAASVAWWSGLTIIRPSSAQASGSAGARPNPAASRALEYFSPSEASFVDAAINRLIPPDALGPGALEAGVTVFIDHQLAGPYGRAADWYMQGPWADGSEEQGYQSRRTPAEVYRAAIVAIDAHSRRSAGLPFAAISLGDQDAWLHALEDGTVDLGEVSAKTFFDLLWQNTQEGFFADPIYLGNRNFIGWQLIGYPGPRYNYDSAIRHYGERYRLPTVGLMGRNPSRLPNGPL